VGPVFCPEEFLPSSASSQVTGSSGKQAAALTAARFRRGGGNSREMPVGKRSSFKRRPMDSYDTPAEAVLPLVPFLGGIKTFAEPCCGDWHLVKHLERHGLRCVYADDIKIGLDALWLDNELGFDAIITNPPWTRELLHPLIKHFIRLAPTWLLFDADWCHTRQAAPMLGHCSHIVTVGRVKWIPDSPFTGKDNAAWYRFDERHADGPRFFGRMEAAA
jgi:hypothetical protein